MSISVLKLLSMIFLMSSIIFAFTVICLVLTMLMRFKRLSKSKGKIVALYREASVFNTDNKWYNARFPEVEYTINDQKYNLLGKYHFASNNIGDKINILYNKNNPLRAVIQKECYVGPVIIGLFMVVSFALGLCFIFFV